MPIPHTVNCTCIASRGHNVATLNRDLGFDFNVLPQHRVEVACKSEVFTKVILGMVFEGQAQKTNV